MAGKKQKEIKLGLLDRVMADGWRSLSSKETGRIGGLLARKKKAAEQS